MQKHVSNKVHPRGSQSSLKFEDALDDSVSKEKERNIFCPSPSPDFELCQSRLNSDQHSQDVKNKSCDQKWFPSTSTRKSEWGCFGNIVFRDQATVTTYSPYIRINDEVNVSQLVEYVHEKWQLSKPSLIISVTGGAVDFAMNKKDHDKLRQSLQRVAATKGAWIITGGTNAGVMKVCGEAVRDQVFSNSKLVFYKFNFVIEKRFCSHRFKSALYHRRNCIKVYKITRFELCHFHSNFKNLSRTRMPVWRRFIFLFILGFCHIDFSCLRA